MELRANLDQFRDTFRDYLKVQKKSIGDALRKQAYNFSRRLYARLKAMAPTKEIVTADIQRAFAAGKGIRVRKSVREEILRKYGAFTSLRSGKQVGIVKRNKKRTDFIFGEGLWSAMKRREETRRRSSVGFTALSVRLPLQTSNAPVESKYVGKGNAILARGSLLDPGENYAHFDIDFGPQLSNESGAAAASLMLSKHEKEINDSLLDSVKDMAQYISERLDRAPELRSKYAK